MKVGESAQTLPSLTVFHKNVPVNVPSVHLCSQISITMDIWEQVFQYRLVVMVYDNDVVAAQLKKQSRRRKNGKDIREEHGGG